MDAAKKMAEIAGAISKQVLKETGIPEGNP
jgi:hypothetical protein